MARNASRGDSARQARTAVGLQDSRAKGALLTNRLSLIGPSGSSIDSEVIVDDPGHRIRMNDDLPKLTSQVG